MAKYVTINTKVKKIVRRGAPGPASADADPTFDSLTLDPAAAAPVSPAQGQAWFDQDEITWTIRQNGTDLQVGQEMQANVTNKEGSTLLDGTPAMAIGSLGASGRITVEKMDGTIPAFAKALFGIATEDIDDNGSGKITSFGKIRSIDTTGIPFGETWLDGDILWISADTTGTLTNIEPPRSSLGMPVGYVIYAHATAGSIFVRITPLDEHLLVTPDQRDALDVANSPSASNAIATIADVGSGGGAIDYANPVSITGAASIPSTNAGKNHVCTGTTANYTLNLPTTGLTAGDLFSFEMSAALTKLVTLDALAGQLIDGQQSRVLWAGEKAVLKWDGTNWQKISGVFLPGQARVALSVNQTGIGSGSTVNIDIDSIVTLSGPLFFDSVNHTIVCKRASAKFLLYGQVRLNAAVHADNLQPSTSAAVYNDSDVVQQTPRFFGSSGVVGSSTKTFQGAIYSLDLLKDWYARLRFFHTNGSDVIAYGDANLKDTYLEILEQQTW